MKTILKGYNRRRFFTLISKGTLGALIVNALPFSKMFAKKTVPTVAARIHPDAVKRTKRG